MQLRDDIDTSTINWTEQADITRRQAEKMPPGAKRNAEIDRALACEALARSGDLLLQTQVE
jgi:hypothetical protein